MSKILIKDCNFPEVELLFPLYDEEEEHFTLQDLQGAFPKATCLRFKDANDSQFHHVLCRDGKFCVPEGGWVREGREYFAVVLEESQSRVERFNEFRQSVTRNRGHFLNSRRHQQGTTSSSRVDARTTTKANVSVGIGCFANGKFTKIAANNAKPGGIVSVGPFEVKENTVSEIIIAAFNKFRSQNINFRRMYKKCEDLTLLYPDGTIVRTLPDGSGAFTLEDYRAFLDPKLKYDRIRLYLCTKAEYELNSEEVEIITDSSTSDDNLPALEFGNTCTSTSDSTISSQEQSNMIESNDIEVRFEWGVHLLSETFPKDSSVQSLMDHLNESPQRDIPKSLALMCDAKFLNPDDRLVILGAGKNNIINIVVEELSTSQTDQQNYDAEGRISGQYEDQESENVMNAIVKIVLNKLASTTEPVAVLHEYTRAYMRGRPLDVQREDVSLEGDTSPIFISRMSLFDDACEELRHQENLRFPLEVTFFGEQAQDLGGPRREFLEKVVRLIKEKIFVVNDGKITIKEDEELLARRTLFYSGLLLGLSVLEGGPLPDFLDGAITDSRDSEYLVQFEKGLYRVGLITLMRKKPSIKFLFRPSATRTLTVNKLLQLLKCKFSSIGSNSRIKEEATYKHFVRYAREVFAGRRPPVTLENVLSFTTGSSIEPVLGFSVQPEIEFHENMFATASTCVNKLYLPLIGERAEDIFFGHLDLSFSNDYFGME